VEGAAGTKPCTLLYLDPDPGTRLLVRRVLEPEGITVVEAGTPIEAERSADSTRPDVVLVDVDRVDTADLGPMRRALRSVGGTLWLASTAQPWPEDCGQILASGFERVLLKPLDVDTLARDIGCGTQVRPASSVHAVPEPGHAPGTNGATPIERRPMLAPVAPPEPEIRPLPALWHLTLAPVTASFVQSIHATHGLLALFDETERALVIAATYSIRSVEAPRGGAPGTNGSPVVGTAIPVATLGWLDPALRARHATVVRAEDIGPSVLIPPGSTTVLLVPVATGAHVWGVVIVGEQRSSRAGAFAPNTVTQSVTEARQIAGVVETLRELDEAMAERRAEMVGPRLDLLRALVTDLSDSRRRRRRKVAGRPRWRSRLDEEREPEPAATLALEVAEGFGLAPREREVLRQALDAVDVGRRWLERMLFPRTTLPVAVREVLLDAYAQHGAEILNELDWPAPVVDLVRVHRTRWDAQGPVPLAARILAAAEIHRSITARGEGIQSRAVIEELTRHAGRRLAPEVVAAFVVRLRN
jgi:CheY-like chemotaxis protein